MKKIPKLNIMSFLSLFTTTTTIIAYVAFYGLQLCSGDPTCQFPYTRTDGKIINLREDKYFSGKPFQTVSSTTTMKCSMMLMASTKAQGMNVVRENLGDFECQLFEWKADYEFQEGVLESKKDSTYYEKIENFVKATSNEIVVGARDDNPGVFTFNLPTGEYRIKLIHLNGGVKCNSNQQTMSHFGCAINNNYLPTYMPLVKGYHGPIAVYGYKFSQYEGSKVKPKFIATSECFKLTEGSDYSFWYYEDYTNGPELDNSGITSFEMFAQLCEKNNECI